MTGVSCNICQKPFTNASSLKRHLRNVHKCDYAKQTPVTKKTFRCALCFECCDNTKEFCTHMYENHQIEIEKKEFSFADSDEFYNWKTKVEGEEKSFFAKLRSKREPKNCVTMKFGCNRSGMYIPRVDEFDRKRELKVQGTCRISGFCPAGINAVFKEDGSVSVKYTQTHVGHETELAHLHLSLEHRTQIASKIAMKIPFDDILNEMRSSTKEDCLKREHLIKRKDLYNIEREFLLKKETCEESYFMIVEDNLDVGAFLNVESSDDVHPQVSIDTQKQLLLEIIKKESEIVLSRISTAEGVESFKKDVQNYFNSLGPKITMWNNKTIMPQNVDTNNSASVNTNVQPQIVESTKKKKNLKRPKKNSSQVESLEIALEAILEGNSSM